MKPLFAAQGDTKISDHRQNRGHALLAVADLCNRKAEK
jgi:hypothetical protein